MRIGGRPVPMALDLVLRNFLKSPAFTALQDKNWSAISRTIPGTTPKQVQRRYEELAKQYAALGVVGTHPLNQGLSTTARNAVRGAGEQRSASLPGSAKLKGNKGDRCHSSSKSRDKISGSGEQRLKLKYFHAHGSEVPSTESIIAQMSYREEDSPVMVIHVCDEAKNLKQDFHCPRDLLVREMRYFSEYLTTDAQRWEEVDISVHCDVQIFDWLMDYVKRSSKDTKEPPRLEPNNVISILISSDFLKMDNLVAECIDYCQANMSAIVATPCNMNCINDKLVGRISDLFNHNGVDAIKDKKDKFKSKLFAKKLEKLFETDYDNPDSPECAATLFKCSICSKLLTKNMEKKVSCSRSRMLIDRGGSLSYQHKRDASWDVNDYLLELKAQLKSWRDVYWRVWGTINGLPCSRCREVFPCTELGFCRYHPESATYELDLSEAGVRQSAIGSYPCCHQRSLRFDPTQPNTGCKVRDHVVHITEAMTSPSIDNCTMESKLSRVYDDLLAHRDAICQPYTQPVVAIKDDADLNVFARDEHASSMKEVTSAKIDIGHHNDDNIKSEPRPQSRPQPRLQPLRVERPISKGDEFGIGESEDELGDDEEPKSRRLRPQRKAKVTVDPQAILLDAPDFGSTKMRKWDSSRSMRWNQDAQREEDQRRMYEITTYLTKLRVTSDKLDKQKQREYSGGLYCRLEAQWKSVNIPPPRTSGAQIRSKPRLNSLKTTLN